MKLLSWKKQRLPWGNKINKWQSQRLGFTDSKPVSSDLNIIILVHSELYDGHMILIKIKFRNKEKNQRHPEGMFCQVKDKCQRSVSNDFILLQRSCFEL